MRDLDFDFDLRLGFGFEREREMVRVFEGNVSGEYKKMIFIVKCLF